MVGSVLSGNRNFEGRVNPLTRANYLMSPMLVVVYALAGNMKIDITRDPIGTGKGGKPVYLKDLWPSNAEIAKNVEKFVTAAAFKKRYADVFEGDSFWRGIKIKPSQTYAWDNSSTYVQNPPYFEGMTGAAGQLSDIKGARVLALLGDSITTDHISPAGSIKFASPAGAYLLDNKVPVADFNQYGTRRGNHEVMMRGTFANIRIKNEMVPGVEGGVTKFVPNGQVMPIYDAAMKYKQAGTPLVVVAGKEYGTGSSRDWAAKGTVLLGVQGGDGRELRAHPPLQPGRHGRHAADLQERHDPQVAQSRRQRDFRHHRPVRRHQAAHGCRGEDHPQGRLGAEHHRHLRHLHPRRGRVFPQRRHPAERAAPSRQGGITG